MGRGKEKMRGPESKEVPRQALPEFRGAYVTNKVRANPWRGQPGYTAPASWPGISARCR